jgi:hypothetical protein
MSYKAGPKGRASSGATAKGPSRQGGTSPYMYRTQLAAQSA